MCVDPTCAIYHVITRSVCHSVTIDRIASVVDPKCVSHPDRDARPPDCWSSSSSVCGCWRPLRSAAARRPPCDAYAAPQRPTIIMGWRRAAATVRTIGLTSTTTSIRWVVGDMRDMPGADAVCLRACRGLNRNALAYICRNQGVSESELLWSWQRT